MMCRLVGITMTIAFACGLVASYTSRVAAQSHSSTVVSASHIRFVYPDSAETSNAPFPPNLDKQAVHTQLRTVLVRWHSRTLTLNQYLRGLHMDPEKVVTIKVQGETAAVYTYR